MKDNVHKGKFLALLLRHKPEVGNLTLDKNGWAYVDGVLKALNINFEELEKIVSDDDKGRYEFSLDMESIRARQGHSIEVDVELTLYIPTTILYHGTVSKSLDAILETGLRSMSRLYVHLSQDVETATKVGSRRGIPFILTIDAVKASQEGEPFWISNNNVILVKKIEPKYITI